MKEVEKKIQGSSQGGLESVVKELDAKVKDISKGRDTAETKLREMEVKTKDMEKTFNKGHELDGALRYLDTRLRNCEAGRTKDNTAITAKIKDVEKRVDTCDVNNKMKTLQDSIYNLNSQIKGIKDENKSVNDEARVTARLERLGKEVSILKTKQSEANSAIDELAKKYGIDDGQEPGGRESGGMQFKYTKKNYPSLVAFK